MSVTLTIFQSVLVSVAFGLSVSSYLLYMIISKRFVQLESYAVYALNDTNMCIARLESRMELLEVQINLPKDADANSKLNF